MGEPRHSLSPLVPQCPARCGEGVVIGDDHPAFTGSGVHETRARRARPEALNALRPLLSEELRERIQRDDLLTVDRYVDRHHRRRDPFDRADDPALVVAGRKHRCGVDGRGRVAGAGNAGEVRARIEHHRKAADDGTGEADNQRGQDAKILHELVLFLRWGVGARPPRLL